MPVTVRRRELIAAIGGAAVWPIAARAQQPAMPVIGFLHSASPAPNAHLVAAFRKGLSEAGFVEGQNAAIEYRYAEGQYDRLPRLARELIDEKVDIIVAVTTANKLPAIYEAREFVQSGGLMSYGTNFADHFASAAVRGTKPRALPVQQPTKFELVINLKTANALGLDVPPTLLAIADEVIE